MSLFINNKVEKTFFELSGIRRRLILLLFLAGFLTLIFRAFYLQSLDKKFLQSKGNATSTRVISLYADRGKITDRNGDILAISSPVESVWVNPPNVKITKDQKLELENILKLSANEVDQKLLNNKKEFIYLKRQISPEDARRLQALKIPGVFFQKEFKRFYPAADITANLVGFTNLDNIGQEGIELSQNKFLSGKLGSKKVIKDRAGKIVDDLQEVKLPQDGHDIKLSIDARIQYLTYRELAKSIDIHKAKAGSAIVLDAKTGEVLAMANLPSYNPNNFREGGGPTRNRAVTDVFEPGSTIKPFTVSSALDAGILNPSSLVEVSSGFMKIGSATIHDAHSDKSKPFMTVSEVIAKSSNVGAARIGLMQTPKDLWSTLNKVGFGMQTGVGFPGEVSGRLRDYKNWGKVDQATISFGHGINLTLLQLAQSYTVFANDGEMKPVTLFKKEEIPMGTKVFSKQTVKTMVDMMEQVVEEGTGSNAKIIGYRVAGKTGTAEKIGASGAYEKNKNIGSFIGLAPASNPRIIMAVMIDEPSLGSHFGGVVAAPVFSNVMADVMKILKIPQDIKTQNKALPQDKTNSKETI